MIADSDAATSNIKITNKKTNSRIKANDASESFSRESSSRLTLQLPRRSKQLELPLARSATRWVNLSYDC